MSDTSEDAAHGGIGWSPRTASLQDELGKVWRECGVDSEWNTLKAVLLHRPGPELKQVGDANEALMLQVPDAALAGAQHDRLAEVYLAADVDVFYVEPCRMPTPNQMFVADLLFMTPEGAILARPASTVRAGEERAVARQLVELGIPILRCVRGNGVFEGADALWINSETVILGTGLRTNMEGAAQVANLLNEMKVKVAQVQLPRGTMHLMGTLRFLDEAHAVCWNHRIPEDAVRVLQDNGYEVSFIPDDSEAKNGMALNFVTLAPNQIVMPAGNPHTQAFYEQLGVKCTLVEVNELHKAAGGIGCLTGVIKRASS
jgi:arginine deiminase